MPALHPTDVLLVIDMQRDFLPSTPGHSSPLPVPGGDVLLPGINAAARHFDHVILTQDWHPAGHISFASTHPGKRPFVDTVEASFGPQVLWPDHCVQGSPGAALAPELDIPHAELILRKGFRREIDSYSAFLEDDKSTPTGLAGYLRERNLTRIFLCGLAFDFCVGFSALDAVHFGFEAIVLEDLTRAIDLPAGNGQPGSVDQTRARLHARQIRTLSAAGLSSQQATS